MSAKEENEELALSVIEALDTGDLSQWSQELSDDYTAQCPGVPTLNKVQSFGYNQRFLNSLPRHALRGPQRGRPGRSSFIHWTVSGTQTERLATVTGRTMPPTRRRATVSGVLLTEARNGKIVREYWYWDQLSLLDQLGIMDHPGLFLTHEGF